MSDPTDLLCRARALRGIAEQSRTTSRSSLEDEQGRFARHAGVLERDAERFENEAFALLERQRNAQLLRVYTPDSVTISRLDHRRGPS
jgi:hypothetical protein